MKASAKALESVLDAFNYLLRGSSGPVECCPVPVPSPPVTHFVAYRSSGHKLLCVAVAALLLHACCPESNVGMRS